MKHKTAELKGAALDFAVALAFDANTAGNFSDFLNLHKIALSMATEEPNEEEECL